MLVQVKENKTKYILESGIENANWKVDGSGGGSGGGAVDSVAGKTGVVTLVKGDVGLGNVDNTSDLSKPISTATQTALNTKVDKVAGKQLSTEDYTTEDKTKLSGLSNYTKPASEPISYITGLQTALDSKVSKNGVEALHSTDALRISGTTLSLYKGDGTFESVVTQDTVYTLPNASATVLGGIKVGTNLSIDANGVLSANDTDVSFTEISNKPTNLSGYGITDAYTKTEVDNLIPDLSEYYKKTETYSKVEVDTKIDDIPPTDLSNYYDKTETYSKVEDDKFKDWSDWDAACGVMSPPELLQGDTVIYMTGDGALS